MLICFYAHRARSLIVLLAQSSTTTASTKNDAPRDRRSLWPKLVWSGGLWCLVWYLLLWSAVYCVWFWNKKKKQPIAWNCAPSQTYTPFHYIRVHLIHTNSATHILFLVNTFFYITFQIIYVPEVIYMWHKKSRKSAVNYKVHAIFGRICCCAAAAGVIFSSWSNYIYCIVCDCVWICIAEARVASAALQKKVNTKVNVCCARAMRVILPSTKQVAVLVYIYAPKHTHTRKVHMPSHIHTVFI